MNTYLLHQAENKGRFRGHRYERREVRHLLNREVQRTLAGVVRPKALSALLEGLSYYSWLALPRSSRPGFRSEPHASVKSTLLSNGWIKSMGCKSTPWRGVQAVYAITESGQAHLDSVVG
jgi:hypothetical protein